MGYVSMDSIKKAGNIPQLFKDMSTDGSGRFCVAAFHQLHCLVRPPTLVLRIDTQFAQVSHIQRLSSRPELRSHT